MINIATDGSCIGNPGPGAYAFIAQVGNETVATAIHKIHTTVGEMEVRGLLEALLFIAKFIDVKPQPVRIQCDSQYVVNGHNQWMANWKAKGWRKKGGLAHADLWEKIHAVSTSIKSAVTVEWVKAHQNKGTLNDQVDELANSCARSQKSLNGPALQLDPVALAPEPYSNPVASNEPLTLDAAVALLDEAQEMIEQLAVWDDTAAHKLAGSIRAALHSRRSTIQMTGTRDCPIG